MRDATFPSALFYELLALVHMQGELAPQGVLIRGAITHGDVFTDGSTVFGPALVRAYELESGNAVYPRIIVDPELLQFFDDGKFGPAHHDHSWESGHVQELLDRAEDGFWFVDYLRAFAGELDAPEKYPEYLADHAKCIAAAKASAGRNLSVAAKIHWLASYHDRVVAELDDDEVAAHGTTKAALMVAGAAPFSFKLPVRREIREDVYWRRVSGPKPSPPPRTSRGEP
ncbi:MAG: hypothetical protein OHK0013_35990 [Sandaracinaceae bacterium]